MVETIVLESGVLAREHRSLVYWPQGDCRGPQPVLYLFRGRGEEWFAKPPERHGRNLVSVVEHLIDLEYLSPFVIVCPDIVEEECHYCAFDLAEPPPSLGTGKYRQFFTEEYFDLIEKKLFGGEQASENASHTTAHSSTHHATVHSSTHATARAIGGFSLGSLAAFTIAFLRPDLFTAVSSYDGAFLYWNYDHPEGYGPPENDLRFDWFPYWFGSSPDWNSFVQANPHSLLQNAAGRRLHGLSRMTYFMHSSAEDHVTANAWREDKLYRALLECGFQQGFEEVLLSPDSVHDWYWVDEHLYRLLPPLSRLLWQKHKYHTK